MTKYFFDSYAVIECLKGNPGFTPFFIEHTGVLTLLNLLEVYYCLLKESGPEHADLVLDRFLPLVVHPTRTEIQRAMAFRLDQKKRRLSYADALGYTIAQSRRVVFLTGDIQFADLPGVAFVK